MAEVRQGHRINLTLITILLLLLACLLTSANWILHGKSVHNFCTLSAQPGFLLKLQIDRFKDLDFSPAYWTSRVLTGLPIHAGYGVQNPLLLMSVFFERFGDAVAFYDGLVQFLGCLGLYFLLLHYGFSWTASTLCAVLLGFNAYYPAYGSDPQLGVLIYFLPWVVLIWDRFICRGNAPLLQLWYCALLALCLSALFVASNIQQYAFVVLFVMIPYAATKVMGGLDLPGGPGKRMIHLDNHELVRILCWGALAGLVNLLLISFELWPTLQTIRLGNRMVNSQFSGLLWLSGLFTLAVLGINAMIRSDHRVGRYARILFLLPVIILAQRGELSHLLTGFFKGFEETGFSIFNRSLSYLLTPLQAAAVAYGVIVARRTAPSSVALFSIGIVGLLIGPHTRWFYILHSRMGPVLDYIGRADFVSIVGLTVGIAVAVDSLRTRLPRGKSRLLVGLILVFLPLESSYLYLTKNLFTDHFRYVQQESPETAFLRNLQPTDRVGWIYDEVHTKYKRGFLPNSLPEYLIPTYFGPASFCVNGYSIVPETAYDYASKAMPTFYGLDRSRPVNNLVDLAGVKYIFSEKPLQVDTRDLQLIQTTREYHIYENPQAFPRVFLVPRVERVPEDQLLQRLSSEDLETLKKVAYLTDANEVAQVALTAGDPAAAAGLGSARIVKYEDQQVEIDCKINRECFLILTDTYHPAWKAYLQGQPVEIHRADFLFRGVKLPPGHHILTFEFDARLNRALFTISCITLLVVLVALLSLPLMRRLRTARPPV